jgi:hypothetical protein
MGLGSNKMAENLITPEPSPRPHFRNMARGRAQDNSDHLRPSIRHSRCPCHPHNSLQQGSRGCRDSPPGQRRCNHTGRRTHRHLSPSGPGCNRRGNCRRHPPIRPHPRPPGPDWRRRSSCPPGSQSSRCPDRPDRERLRPRGNSLLRT